MKWTGKMVELTQLDLQYSIVDLKDEENTVGIPVM